MLQELTYSDTSSAGNRVGAPPIRVLLVDDHPAVIAIRRLFRGRQYFPAIAPSITSSLRDRLEPCDRAIFSMLIDGIPPADIGARLGLAPAEVETRRTLMLRVIAPRTGRARVIATARSPLDYDRPRRRLRYRAVG